MFRKSYHPLDRRHPNNSAAKPDLSTSALPVTSHRAPSEPVHLAAHEVFARKGKRQTTPQPRDSRSPQREPQKQTKIGAYAALIDTAYRTDKWLRLGVLAFFMAVLLIDPHMRHAFFEASRAAVIELVTGAPTHINTL